jgi:ABC-type antimicrobial peptide transport system permease subunit
MGWRRQIAKFRGLFDRERRGRELREEFCAHLAMEERENLESGMSPEEAHYAALRQFGNVTLAQEGSKEMWNWNSVEILLQDVRYGLRQLRRSPGFTIVAVLTLALGIGANTAIFSVVNAVALRPLPYPHGDRLVWIAEVLPAIKAEVATGGDYVDWKDQSRSLDGITAYDEQASFNLTGRGTPARVHGAQVTASFFATLGAGPQLGRGFTAEEDQPNGRKVVVLMHPFWQQYFGSDLEVLGQTVTLDSAPYTVVAVMPASFRFPGDSEVQMLVPLALSESSERLRTQMQRLVRIIGRLKPGVSLASAQGDLDAIRKRRPSGLGGPAMPGPGPAPAPRGQHAMFSVFTSGPGPASPNNAGGLPGPPTRTAPGTRAQASQGAGSPPSQVARLTGAPSPSGQQAVGPPGPIGLPAVELKVLPLAEHLAGNLRPAMLTLLGVVGLVLLIACANVANLMLTRASARTREVAVRAALGASRWRLVRQLLAESVTLALAGGIAGLAVAAWGVSVMSRFIPSGVGSGILSVAHPHVDANVLLFALVVSIVTGILFGLAPAVVAARPDLAEGLKESAQVASASRHRGWLRGALAVTELALALMLLIGAGLLIRSFYRVLSVDPGFAPERVLTTNLSLTDSRYPNPHERTRFFTEVLRRVESLPGVRSAALGDSLPLCPYRAILRIRRELATPNAPVEDSSSVLMSRLTVSPGYFYTLGIPVLKGRTFTDHDDERSPKVAVVNETLARLMWPGENPVGRQLPLIGENLTVIGVVGNTRHEGLSQDVKAEIYVPYLQDAPSSMQLALRTASDPSSLVSAVRGEVAAIDPDEPIYQVATLEQTLSDSVAPRRFNMLLLGIFAFIALALSTVGIYGVMAFSVTQRTHEIGIRMALGAERRAVLGLVVREALRLTLVGILVGVAGAWALTRLLTSFPYAVRPTDPLTFLVVPAGLVAVAILASCIPARRAANVDPMVALRYE